MVGGVGSLLIGVAATVGDTLGWFGFLGCFWEFRGWLLHCRFGIVRVWIVCL